MGMCLPCKVPCVLSIARDNIGQSYILKSEVSINSNLKVVNVSSFNSHPIIFDLLPPKKGIQGIPAGTR